ncbi:MAG: PEP-CTERM sorting domain-containing protein [Desulfobaccales bacterium]
MRSRIKMRLMATVLAAFMLCIIGPASATTWNAAAGFSTSINPNGVWTYGSSNSPGVGIIDYESYFILTPTVLEFWNNVATEVDYDPSVFKNPAVTPTSFSTLTLPAGALAFHPGQSIATGLYSNIMWTAPAAGNYVINATFTGYDTKGTQTYVYVLVNGITEYSSEVNGYLASVSYSPTVFSLASGGTVDFAVGATDRGFNNDTTGIAATISSVPVPPTVLLLGSGLLGLVGLKRKFKS